MARKKDDQPALKLPAYVVLGMLRLGARSGYDIKQLIDVAGRHFWAINYPQIYPELDRLQELGFIVGKSDKKSGRRRKLYKITKPGERELDRWLGNEEQPSLEIRDVGLLKVLFADGPEVAADQIAILRQRSEDTIALLESQSRPIAAAIEDEGNPFPLVTVDFGIELHRSIVRTCRKMERTLHG